MLECVSCVFLCLLPNVWIDICRKSILISEPTCTLALPGAPGSGSGSGVGTGSVQGSEPAVVVDMVGVGRDSVLILCPNEDVYACAASPNRASVDVTKLGTKVRTTSHRT